ncbi:MAG TPA: LuxR C-terminal-related transcriptional regulator [Edaphocola sp.]|nr:LuxR C-terminal-related transcriptional regulator [Edaphocola sp.]
MRIIKTLFFIQLLISIILFISTISCNNRNSNHYIDNALIHQNDSLKTRGKVEEIITLNKQFINLSKQQQYKRGEILGNLNIANISATIGKYDEAMKFLNNANKLLKSKPDDYLNMLLNHEYAQLSFVMGLKDVALNYNSKAIYYAAKMNPDSIKRILSNIYTVRADFIYSKSKDSSLYYFYKGVKVDNSELNNALIGNFYSVELRNQDSAYFYFQKALKKLEGQDTDIVRRGIVYSFYGHYLYGEERLNEAMAYYENAAEILLRTNRINKLPILYNDIIQICEVTGNKVKEIEYKQKYKLINDSLQSSSIKAIDLFLAKAIKEIDTYKISKQPSYKLYILMSSVAIVILLILYYLYSKIKKNSDFPSLENPDSESNDIRSDERLKEIVALAKANDSEFLVRFNEFNPEFSQKLYAINQSLSVANITFCAYLWLGFSSKEIAQYTFVQHRSVQTQKNRIRRKLNIDSETDLYKFFREL